MVIPLYIANTAVMIGLGALITGVAAYFIAKLKRNGKAKKVQTTHKKELSAFTGNLNRKDSHLKKPVIFVSSTIYDFRDLRSALKYWLEQLGYEVRMSEFNDFTKPIDDNSYNACLRSIEESDYFILLIGSRVGGLYGAENISITQKEYRTAYERAKAGDMKLVTFVRQDVWIVREDRKGLKELLVNEYKDSKELSDAEIAAITKYPSNVVNDPEAIFAFLYEVGKIDEMKLANEGKGEYPVANWIQPFSKFEDIIKTLEIEFNTKRSLNSVALRVNLKREVQVNLSLLTHKGKDGKLFLRTYWGDAARSAMTGEYTDSSTMPTKYIGWLTMWLGTTGIGEQLSTQFLDQALETGEFLEYDFENNTYKASLLHNSLFSLKENIS